ncbi:unnamed protein product [Rotaria magnacalcarata]|uniref:Uncharacterized protein n=4 Tax=Rotaria magnacalcarata TaxID=392030 RepID=A0A816VD34_9BILA|nr:unnamed protein product [Rotaria magnacalcarata]CAF2118564.1 unnamed protein product [Rotaria magnacalcarata]CAF3741393.1 unnamed protein product [Rotaria magnacalcarata]CAF3976403.1 unnamed protein product [Rotaria magnacalcarata]
MNIRLLIFSIFIPIVTSSTLSSPELNIKYGGLALNALERLLNFFESDAKDLNLDGVYGLRIAQGQLNSLNEILTSSSHENQRFTDKNHYIQSLSIEIERITNRSLIALAKTASSYLQRFLLVASKPFQADYDVRKIKKKFFEKGSRTAKFDEDESDGCFAELLGSTDRPNATKCLITQPCWSMMTTSMTKDYRLTHQLLWFLVAKSIGCIDNRAASNVSNKNLKYLEDQYCSNIYLDAQLNIAENTNQDLFLEQLLLCSIIGYEDFLRFDWLDMILSWQEPKYGCFSSASETAEPNLRIKRHLLIEQEMDHGCLSHKSGLAAGLLATYARAFLQ